MSDYKANQLFSALYAVHSGPGHTAARRMGEDVPGEFRSRVKHLLEMDRKRITEAGDDASGWPGLFHDEMPRGKGHEVRYSARNAFALSVAIHLIDAGFPQLRAYQALVALWSDLSREFARISRHVKARGSTTSTDSTRENFPKIPSKRHPDIELSDVTVFLLLPQLARANREAFPLEGVEFLHGVKEFQSRLRTLMPDEIHGVYVLELSGLIKRFNELVGMIDPVRRGPNN